MTFKVRGVLRPKTQKNSVVEEGEGSASLSKQREIQREITTFCLIICKFKHLRGENLGNLENQLLFLEVLYLQYI